MAVKSSLVLTQKQKPCRSKTCKACGLYLNQAPIYDKIQKSSVFWVGLSAVRIHEGNEKLPLSPFTPSGSLIHKIEEPYKSKYAFYKTNLVKCVPLKDDKIRYPLEHEMEKCFSNFESEINDLYPSTIFLLGKQVANFVFKKFTDHKPSFSENFTYNPVEIRGISFIPIHHPSYILVYKRKNLNQYIKNVQKLFPDQVPSGIATF